MICLCLLFTGSSKYMKLKENYDFVIRIQYLLFCLLLIKRHIFQINKVEYKLPFYPPKSVGPAFSISRSIIQSHFERTNNDSKLYNLSNVIIKLSKQYAKSSPELTTSQDPQYPFPEVDLLQQTCTEYSEVPKQKNTM